MLRRSRTVLIIAPSLKGRRGLGSSGGSTNTTSTTSGTSASASKPAAAPLVRVAQKAHPSSSNNSTPSSSSSPLLSHLQPHEVRLQQLLSSAFPIATIKFIGKQTRRIGTEADFLYTGSGNGDGGGASVATLGGKHDNSIPIRTLSELIQRNQGGAVQHLVTNESARSAIPPWSGGSFLVDYARYCSIGPIKKTSPEDEDVSSGSGGEASSPLHPAESALPPLYAPRLNPRRLALEAVVFLPGFHPSDLRKIVARNLVKHLPKLNPRLASSGTSGAREKKGQMSLGFQSTVGAPPTPPSSSSTPKQPAASPPSPTEGTPVQRKILDNDYLFQVYGLRVLSDCIEMVVEADVPVYRCPDLSSPGSSSSSIELHYVRERRTVYVGFASPAWQVHPIRSGVDESERHAVRVACGLSRETIRRSLPTPVLDAANLLHAYAKDVVDRRNEAKLNSHKSSQHAAAMSRQQQSTANNNNNSNRGYQNDDNEAFGDGGDEDSPELKNVRGGTAYMSNAFASASHLTAPSPIFWLNIVLTIACRAGGTQCSVLNDIVNREMLRTVAPPPPSMWGLASEPAQGTRGSAGGVPHPTIFPVLSTDEGIQYELGQEPDNNNIISSTTTAPPSPIDAVDSSGSGRDDVDGANAVASSSSKLLSDLFHQDVDRQSNSQSAIESNMRALGGIVGRRHGSSMRDTDNDGGKDADDDCDDDDEGGVLYPKTMSSCVLHPWRNLEWLRLRALTCPDTIDEAFGNNNNNNSSSSSSGGSNFGSTNNVATLSSAANMTSKRLHDWRGSSRSNHFRQLASLHTLRKRLQLRCYDDQQLRDSESMMMAALFSLSGYDFMSTFREEDLIADNNINNTSTTNNLPPSLRSQQQPILPLDAFATYACLVGRSSSNFIGHDDSTATEALASDMSERSSSYGGGGGGHSPNQRLVDLKEALKGFNTDHMVLELGSITCPFDGPNHFNVVTNERELRLMAASLADSVVGSIVRSSSSSESAVISLAIQNTSLLPLEKFMGTTTELRNVLAGFVEVCRGFNSKPPNFLSQVSNDMQRQ